MKEPRISIIIPCKNIDEYTNKCIKECLILNYSNFEIIVLPDEKPIKNLIKNKKLKMIYTGNVKPAFKRNLGMEKSNADFYAFIDSDAYPDKDWLKNAIKHFQDKQIGIVGGPNLTPNENEINFWEKVSGNVLKNFFVTGKANIRYKISKNQFTNELPSCNYISRKEASSEYDPKFLTAEDSEFCFNCSKKGYKILYVGDVVVYHHRRNSFKKHLKQMWVYGRDIAGLTKKEFSFDKMQYSILSVFSILFIILFLVAFFNDFIKWIFIYSTSVYLIIMCVTNINENIKMSFFCIITGILTHFSYGFGWIYGILSKHKT